MVRFKLTSARALGSQFALISLILFLQSGLGQIGKVSGTILSSIAMSLFVYSLNIPKMTLRKSGEPKHGAVISLASGWMYLVGVLVVQGTLAYAGRETILEPDTIGNYAFFAVFFMYIPLTMVALEITEKRWNLTQQDIGGGPVAAYAGMLGMAGIFGTISIITIGIFARETSGKIKEKFLTVWPLRRKSKKGIKDILAKAESTSAFLFLLMLFVMPNVSIFINDLFQVQPSLTDIVTICLLISAFLGTLFSLYRNKFKLSWKLLTSFPFMISLCLTIPAGSMSIYPVYRDFLAGVSRTIDIETALLLDSIISSFILVYVLMMFCALFDLEFFPNGGSVYPLFGLASLAGYLILDIHKIHQNSFRMLLIFLVTFFSFSIVALTIRFLKEVFKKLYNFRLKHLIVGGFLIVHICLVITLFVSGIWLFSIMVIKGSLDIIRNWMEPIHVFIVICFTVFLFFLIDSSELVKD